ncbi:MAG: universal stress protein [Dehalococcoidia bacterium]|jgi:nucleotide-binding universal stress UspA family protein|nr:universal stress protein [Dehalococcoidia bacterium]
MFDKILVCLDGSPLSEQVVPYSTEVAQRFGSRVVILQVLQIPSSLAAASAQGAENVIEEELRRLSFEAHQYLDGIATKMKENGVQTEVSVIEGTPGDAIVEFASQSGIELIVLATHGRKSLGRLVFGSVADHVIRNTTIPVLSVKPDDGKE